MKTSLMVFGLALASISAAQPKFSHPNRIRYDGQCFTIEGKDTFIFSGAFHYFRCPKELWRARFKSIKEAGFNAVETYVAWNWSEQTKPKNLGDVSNVKLDDLDEWMRMAEDEFGLYTIVRPGPYICSEWATGGFPNWLQTFRPNNTKRPVWYRSDDPVFQKWSDRWMAEVAKVVDKHQVTHRKPGQKGMILWQVENEYDYSAQPDDAKRNYVRGLILASQKAGIDVPIFTCWTSQVRYPKGDTVLAQAFDNPNEYPRWNIQDAANAIDAQHRAQPWAPKMITEFQGGWFGGVGGQSAIEQGGINDQQIKSLTIWSIANGLTGLNYYMLFGGTNFGDWAGQGITTCYDYNCPIREWGGVGAKFAAVKSVGDVLTAHGVDLARSTEVPSSRTKDGDVVSISRRSKSGLTYVFYWNQNRNSGQSIDAGNGASVDFPAFGSGIFAYHSKPSDGSWLVSPRPWYPKPMAPTVVRLKEASASTLMPFKWKSAPSVPSTTALGVWDSRFISYRVSAPLGKFVWLQAQDSELVGDKQPIGPTIRGGGVWKSNGTNDFVLFNPGWPNGGTGMELAHGIIGAKVLDKAPDAAGIGGWKMKMLSDQNDRSLTAETVDTSDSRKGVTTAIIRPHTTAVIRTTVELANDPKPDMTFNCSGVDDEGWFYVNGHLVGEIHTWDVPVTATVGKFLHKGTNSIAIVVRNNDGPGGLTGTVTLDQPLPKSANAKFQWTDQYAASKSKGYSLDLSKELLENEHPRVEGPRPMGSAHLTRSTVRFDLPSKGKIWEMRLDAGGDGFLTLNGHPLGRFWEVGPQRGFYLPEPWLKAKGNVLELTVVPGRFGDRIKAAALQSLPERE